MKDTKITGYYINGDDIKFTNKINKTVKKIKVRKVIDIYLEEIKKM